MTKRNRLLDDYRMDFVHHAPGGYTGDSAIMALFPPCHPKYVTEGD